MSKAKKILQKQRRIRKKIQTQRMSTRRTKTHRNGKKAEIQERERETKTTRIVCNRFCDFRSTNSFFKDVLKISKTWAKETVLVHQNVVYTLWRVGVQDYLGQNWNWILNQVAKYASSLS